MLKLEEKRQYTLEEIKGRLITWNSTINSMNNVLNELHIFLLGVSPIEDKNDTREAAASRTSAGFIKESTYMLDEMAENLDSMCKKLTEIAEACLPQARPRS